VLKRRKAGQSLRSIADDTGLSLQTVRTATGKADGTDRATTNRLQRIAVDKLADARVKARQRERDALPKRITQTRARGVELIKRSKGL
jgi:DNA-binding IclR family transcriptional regulator